MRDTVGVSDATNGDEMIINQLQTLYNVATHVAQLLHPENLQLAADNGFGPEFQELLKKALDLRTEIVFACRDRSGE